MSGRTPDAFNGPRFEEESSFERTTGFQVGGAGGLRFDDATGEWVMVDDIGAFNPRTGGGISEPQHEDLDTLVHNLSETYESIPTFDADGIITSVQAQGAGGGNAIRRMDNFTADSDGLITGWRKQQFDGAGALVQTLTGSITNVACVPTEMDVVEVP